MRCREMLRFKDISERYFREGKNEVHDMFAKVNIESRKTEKNVKMLKSVVTFYDRFPTHNTLMLFRNRKIKQEENRNKSLMI